VGGEASHFKPRAPGWGVKERREGRRDVFAFRGRLSQLATAGEGRETGTEEGGEEGVLLFL